MPLRVTPCLPCLNYSKHKHAACCHQHTSMTRRTSGRRRRRSTASCRVNALRRALPAAGIARVGTQLANLNAFIISNTPTLTPPTYIYTHTHTNTHTTRIRTSGARASSLLAHPAEPRGRSLSSSLPSYLPSFLLHRSTCLLLSLLPAPLPHQAAPAAPALDLFFPPSSSPWRPPAKNSS